MMASREYYYKYVAAFHLSRRLVNCGLKLTTLFNWSYSPQIERVDLILPNTPYLGSEDNRYPAPTAFEIKEALPDEIWVTINTKNLRRRLGIFHFMKVGGLYKTSLMVHSEDKRDIYEFHREEAESEADSVASMLAYIHENNLCTI